MSVLLPLSGSCICLPIALSLGPLIGDKLLLEGGLAFEGVASLWSETRSFEYRGVLGTHELIDLLLGVGMGIALPVVGAK